MDYDIDRLVGEIDFHSMELVHVSKNVLLTNHEIEVLNRHNINYKNCNSLKEIIFMIEDILDDSEIIDEELDLISEAIAERDYYQNTNK